MTTPSGSAPWFARVKDGRRWKIQPRSLTGWLATGLYAAAMTGVSLLLIARDEPVMVEWLSWAAMTTAMTVAFLLPGARRPSFRSVSLAPPGRVAAAPFGNSSPLSSARA